MVQKVAKIGSIFGSTFLKHLELFKRLLGAFVRPGGSAYLGGHLEFVWLAFLGSLGMLWGTVRPSGGLLWSQGGSSGSPGRSCRFLGRSWGGLQENPGKSRSHFGIIVGGLFIIVCGCSGLSFPSFFDAILCGFVYHVGSGF